MPGSLDSMQAHDHAEIAKDTAEGIASYGDASARSAERAQQILDKRARLLANPPSSGQVAGAVIDVLTFELAHELYAIETAFVREVLRLKQIMPVPRTPNLLYGIGALRGELLPIFDLRQFFNLPPKNPTTSSKVIILGRNRTEFGIVADDVTTVVSLEVDAISESADRDLAVDRSYLRGVTKDALIVLNGRRLLEEPSFFLE